MRKTFRLNKANGKLMGVCSGIADYTGIDATIVRVALVIATIAGGFPWTLIAYGIVAWAAKPALGSDSFGQSRASLSTADYREGRDLDQRLAEIDTYVAGQNSRLAQEIEQLR